jgi:hypothetical protein
MAAAQLGYAGRPIGRPFDTVMVSTRAGVHPEMHPAADQVPPRRDRDGLTDGVQVAPAAAVLKRSAAAMSAHQVQRRACAAGSRDRDRAGLGRFSSPDQ